MNGGAYGNGLAESNGLGKPSRPRHMNPNRTTMNDMKRRVAGILEFISHTQVEMAGLDATKPKLSMPNSTKASMATSKSKHLEMDIASIDNMEVSGGLSPSDDPETVDEESFRKLNSVEMMEVLTRSLMRWQAQYGKYGEK